MSNLRPFNTLFPGYYQTAYVTNDLQHATGQVGNAYGIADWLTIDGFSFPVKPSGEVVIDLALAYIGDSQIELIQPVGGNDALYRDSLRDEGGFELVFHHLCKAFDTREQFHENLADLKRRDIPIPMDNTEHPENGIALACYGDFRASLGHYLEYVWFTEAGAEWMAQVPRHD